MAGGRAQCTMNFDEVAAKRTCCPPLRGKSGHLCALDWRRGLVQGSRAVSPLLIHAQATSSRKLRLRRLSCNGLNVTHRHTGAIYLTIGLTNPTLRAAARGQPTFVENGR